MTVEPLVTTAWLQDHLGDPRSASSTSGATSRPGRVEPGVEEASYRGAIDEYRSAHIPGAVYIDWTRDIVDPDDPVPAQLAPPELFAQAMAERGIGDATHVIAVDHAGGQFATRLWWALTYYGHDAVSVLDGGWNRWVDGGPAGRVGAARRSPRRRFHARPRPELRATADAGPRPAWPSPASS